MATAVQAAQHIHLSPSRFRDYVAQGVIRRRPSGRYDLDEVREAYCLHAQKVMAGRLDEGGKSLSTQRARLATAQAQAAEMKNMAASGQLVSLEAVGRVFDRYVRVFRERCLNVPGSTADSLSPHCAEDRIAIEGILRDQMYAALEDIADPKFMERMADEVTGRNNARRRSDHDAADIEDVVS
jgi:phage terminase Nu1 subunit (DNA packaging protein)